MTNLYDAHTQWLRRPVDERFADLEALHASTQRRREVSSEVARDLRHLHVDVTPDGAVAVNGETPTAYLTHWAFSQLAATVGAPARYLRSLPPQTVRDCLTHGLAQSVGQCKLLFRAQPSQNGIAERAQIAAFTGPTYGRIWDADIVASLIDAVAGTGWHVPPARSNNESESAGLYASDRDMFAFFVNDDNPVAVGNAKLGRGFFIWNSETGAATFGLTTFLYNYVCGNHIVWGAEQVKDVRIVHRHGAPTRFTREALPTLNRFVESRTVSDTVAATVSRAMTTKVGSERNEVIQWFVGKPFTKHEVIAGFQAGHDAGDDVSSLWGMIQGFTASARTLPFAGARVDLERRAGQLLR